MQDLRAHDWIRHHARRRPQKRAIVDFESGAELTYRDMDRQANACAAFLYRRHNIASGDRVALLAQNCPEVFVIQAACSRLKAIFLPLNWRLAEPELCYMLSDASPKAVLADARFIETAERICAKQDGCQAVQIGEGTEFHDLLLGGDRIEDLCEPFHSDIWHILYTSGTTGRPKGAMLSHGQNYLQAVNLGLEYGVTHETVGLTYTPTFHASGLFMFANPSLLVGATTYLMRQFDALACLKTLMDPEIGITHTLAIPTNLLMIRNLPEFQQAQFNGLVIASGGAPVASTLIETYGAHGARIPQVWGMTELCGVSTSLPAEESLKRTGSCGPPLMNMDISIIDQEDNHITKPETVGEIVARGPMVMKGYWGLGDKNKEFFASGGWFRTGDAGRLSADGYLTIVGRWKDMYISGGENVYPAEVEDVIYKMPAVDEVAVLGVPHEKWGETGLAYVVVKAGESLTGEEVIAYCKTQLATYKVPKSVVFLDELPHSANGKILKHKIPADIEA